MLSFGEQLYQLTRRDLETLAVESFMRNQIVGLVSNQLQAGFTFPVPIDRSLYIHSFQVNAGSAGSGNFYTEFLLNFLSASGATPQPLYNVASSTFGLKGDDFAGDFADTTNFAINRTLGVVLPPGTNGIAFSLARPINVAITQVRFSLLGYLVPPGGIGRN